MTWHKSEHVDEPNLHDTGHAVAALPDIELTHRALQIMGLIDADLLSSTS